MAQRGVLHVIQASWGDALLLEYDKYPKPNSDSIEFMLVDGGPARTTRYHVSPSVGQARSNLFNLLNYLSGEAISKPANGLLKTLATLVLTHDDEDHKQGIQDLIASLLQPAHPDLKTFNAWLKGNEMVSKQELPILNIWYNSLQNVMQAQRSSTPKEGWFDKQLSELNRRFPRPLISFNTQLAPDGATGVHLVKQDVKSGTSSTTSDVEKGQFTIKFLGPTQRLLTDPGQGLVEAMDLTNSLKLPKFQFGKEIGAKAGSISNKVLKAAINLVDMTRGYDGEKKNLSSIAFNAEDRTSGKRILLLGDSTARELFLDKYVPRRVDRYQLMKIMHHGSYKNSSWPRTPDRMREERDEAHCSLTNSLTNNFLKNVVFFFAKVTADKYVISASLLEMHPNPHVTTIIGIIVAAVENGDPVDIYLTNPLSPQVRTVVGDFVQMHSASILPLLNMRILVGTANSGTIDLYGHGDTEWETYDPRGRDLWSGYTSDINARFPALSGMTYPVLVVRPSKLKRFEANIPPSGPITRPGLLRKTLIVGIKGSPPSHGEFGFRLPPQAPGFVWAPHPERTVSNMLLGTPLKVDHGRLSSYLPPDTRTFTDLASLLQYLVDQGCLTSTKAGAIVSEASTTGGYVLAALLTLFMGTEASEGFLASLPCDLSGSPNYLSEDNSPSFWVASNFVVEVIDSKLPEFRGWPGIHSISFDLISDIYSDVKWKLPFGTASPNQTSDGYFFQHDRPMSFIILQPTHLMRLISGQFRGALQWKTTNYHIVADFSLRYQQPAEYIFKFSDEQYKTDDFKISIGDVLRLLNCTDIDFGGNLARVILPGIESVLDSLKDSTGLNNGQFVLQKILSRVLLTDISAELVFHEANWQPFGSTKFSFTVEKLRARLRQVNSIKDRQFCIELDGSMNFNDSEHIQIPFQLSASFTLQGFMLFEVTLLPGDNDSLSVSQLLDVAGLGSILDLGTSFPGIANLSNALSITHVSLGWIGLGSLLPDFFKLAISLDDWDVIDNVLHIKKSNVEIQAGNLSSNGPISLSLHGWGSVMIGSVELELYFNFAHGGADGLDMISVQIAAEGRSIRLGDIIKHFFGDSLSILPQKFVQLLDETGINHFIIQAMRTNSSWSISQLELSVRVETELDIFAEMTIEYPTLLVNIHYPFDSKQRTISASIDAILHVGDVPSNVSIIITSEAETEIALIFEPVGSPLTVRDMVGQFIPDSATVTLPDTVSFLTDIGLQRASLAMQLGGGKFSLSQILVSVVSSSTLTLWDEITLEQLSLFFSYTKGTEKTAEFYSMLTFADNTDYLEFSLVYESTSQSGTSGGGSSLSATAKYSGTISTLDILNRVSGIDLRKCFEDLSLSALADVLDIRMSNLTATLRHDTTTNAFSFDADTDWLCFSHLRFACSKSQSWSYSLGFSIRPDVDVLQYIPILGPILDHKITLTNIAVVIFNHVLDVAALPTALSVPAKSTITQSAFNVAFAGKLTLVSSPLETLAKALDINTVDILGIVGNKNIFLSISVKPLYLFNGELSIAGSVIIICSEETEMLPKVGVQGTAVLNFGEHVSKNPITTTLFLFVDFSTTGLGFKFTLDQWEEVFGYDGLNFKDVVFEAEFPPEQFPVPSEFTVAGTIDLSVNKAKFDGSVNLHFVEQDILKSYAMGSINGLTLNNIIEAFSNADQVPQFLDLGFGPLEFKIVPTDLVDSKGKVINQQFYLSGSFKIPYLHFSADGKVDITTSHVIVDGRLSPIIVLDKRLFSILASSSENPPPPSDSGASIHISVNADSSPFGVKISGRMTFLSITNDIYLKASTHGLEFTIDREWVAGGTSLHGIINKEQLALSASYTFSLDLHIPNLVIGSVPFGDIFIDSFSASLDTTVDWGSLSWALNVTGDIDIGGLSISKSFTFDADLKDLSSLAEQIALAILKSFVSDLLNLFNELIDDIEHVLTVLKDAFDLELSHMITFIHESCGVDVDDVPDIIEAVLTLGFNPFLIVKVIVDVFEMSILDVWKIINNSHPHERPKHQTTLTEVQDMLQLTLATNVNNLLHNPVPIKSSTSSQFPTLVCQYAIDAFNKEFGYDYDGTSTTPSDAISPANLTAADGIFSFTDKEQEHVGDFMKDMLNAQNVPDWIHDKAQMILLNWTKDLAHFTTENDWQHIALVHTYNPQDEAKQYSIRTNTILVYVNGSLTIDDVTANETVIYYVGVYYQAMTPLMAARQKLRTNAYNQANSIMNNGKVIKDDISLTTALKSYGETLFDSHFYHNKWGGNPSDYADDGSYLKVNADALGYFEDGKVDGVNVFVKSTLLKGASIPDWTSDAATSDMVSTFTNATNYPDSGSWSSLNVDETYDDPNGVHNSLRVNAVVVYYLDSTTVDDGTPVKMAYIFWMGMFYEKPSPAMVVNEDMIEQLYNNLHYAMNHVSTENLMANKAGLITLLSRCASSKFKSEFGYDFNVRSMTPSDSNGDEVYAVECFGEFKDVTQSDVSVWTKDTIFKAPASYRDRTFSFFTNVPDLGLKAQLDDQIFWWLTQNSVATDGNNWEIDEYEHSHSHPLDSYKFIKTAAVVFCANGNLTESATTEKSNVFYYMGVYYVANDSDSGSEV